MMFREDSDFNSAPSYRAIIGGLLLAVSLCLCVILAVYAFANPDMTRMRILFNQWPLYIAAVLAAVIGGLLIQSDE